MFPTVSKLIGVMLVLAGGLKLWDFVWGPHAPDSNDTIVSRWLGGHASVTPIFAVGEIALGIGCIVGSRWCAGIASLAFGLFAGILIGELHRTTPVQCGCFGPLGASTVGLPNRSFLVILASADVLLATTGLASILGTTRRVSQSAASRRVLRDGDAHEQL